MFDKHNPAEEEDDGDEDHPMHDDSQIKLKMSSRYNILNNADLKRAFDNMPKDIEFRIETSELTRSGSTMSKAHKITIHYDKYNPNRAGNYMELPEWISRKTTCINI